MVASLPLNESRNAILTMSTATTCTRKMQGKVKRLNGRFAPFKFKPQCDINHVHGYDLYAEKPDKPDIPGNPGGIATQPRWGKLNRCAWKWLNGRVAEKRQACRFPECPNHRTT